MIERGKNIQRHTVKVNGITAHYRQDQFQINCNIVLEGQLRQLNILLSKEMLSKALSSFETNTKPKETRKRLSQILNEKNSYSYLNTDRWFGKPMILENCILNLTNPLRKRDMDNPIELIGMNSEKQC